MSGRLKNELDSFRSLWRGGYFEGDPLQPLSWSGYRSLGFMSTLHATYLCCIKPYVTAETVALEIGPGRGAFTRALLPSREVHVLDAVPAAENGFFEYLGHPKHVTYHHVTDFTCSTLPEDHFTYMFSFGCLCHVSFEGIEEYAANLRPKMRSGAHCFWLIADYGKYNAASEAAGAYWSAAVPDMPGSKAIRSALRAALRRRRPAKPPDVDQTPSPGRWYDAGLSRTCRMLEKHGYTVIDPDVGTCLRDPIIHFARP
jgi:hypothetical protein